MGYMGVSSAKVWLNEDIPAERRLLAIALENTDNGWRQQSRTALDGDDPDATHRAINAIANLYADYEWRMPPDFGRATTQMILKEAVINDQTPLGELFWLQSVPHKKLRSVQQELPAFTARLMSQAKMCSSTDIGGLAPYLECNFAARTQHVEDHRKNFTTELDLAMQALVQQVASKALLTGDVREYERVVVAFIDPAEAMPFTYMPSPSLDALLNALRLWHLRLHASVDESKDEGCYALARALGNPESGHRPRSIHELSLVSDRISKSLRARFTHGTDVIAQELKHFANELASMDQAAKLSISPSETIMPHIDMQAHSAPSDVDVPQPMTRESVESIATPEYTFAPSTRALWEVVRNRRPLPMEERKLLDIIAQAHNLQQITDDKIRKAVLQQAREARGCLAEYYLNIALAAVNRHKRNNKNFDDFIQRATEVMLEAIDSFADMPQANSPAGLAAYIKTCIDFKLRTERRKATTTVSASRDALDKIGKILQIKDALYAQGLASSPEVIAQKLGMKLSEVVGLLPLSQAPRSVDGMDKVEINRVELAILEQLEQPEIPETSLAKKIWIERGLTLLPSTTAQVLRMKFGFDGLFFPNEEIIEVLDLKSESALNGLLERGQQALTEILPDLQEGSFDFADWHKKHPTMRNVMLYLGLMGVPIPENARLPNLRQRARDHLYNLPLNNPKHRQIITDLYGLNVEGRTFTTAEVAAQYDITQSTARDLNSRFLDRYAKVTSLEE